MNHTATSFTQRREARGDTRMTYFGCDDASFHVAWSCLVAESCIDVTSKRPFGCLDNIPLKDTT